jgi:hypothetical protein
MSIFRPLITCENFRFQVLHRCLALSGKVKSTKYDIGWDDVCERLRTQPRYEYEYCAYISIESSVSPPQICLNSDPKTQKNLAKTCSSIPNVALFLRNLISSRAVVSSRQSSYRICQLLDCLRISGNGVSFAMVKQHSSILVANIVQCNGSFEIRICCAYHMTRRNVNEVIARIGQHHIVQLHVSR